MSIGKASTQLLLQVVLTKTDTATALVDLALAALRAATASPSPPVSVIEHATLTTVDVVTKSSSETNMPAL